MKKSILLVALALGVMTATSCKKEEFKHKDYQVTYRLVCNGIEQWRDTYTTNDTKNGIESYHSTASTSEECVEEVLNITEL